MNNYLLTPANFVSTLACLFGCVSEYKLSVLCFFRVLFTSKQEDNGVLFESCLFSSPNFAQFNENDRLSNSIRINGIVFSLLNFSVFTFTKSW